MPETVYRTIGSIGEFSTLAEFAAAIPPSLVAVDQIWVGLLTSDIDDPGGATFRSICDATRYIEVRAAPGQSFADQMDPEDDALVPTSGQGALIRTGFGDALRAENPGTRVHLVGLQIIADVGAALGDDEDGGFAQVEGCLLQGNTSAPAVTIRTPGGRIANSVVIQDGSGDGLALTGSTAARNCTMIKPDRLVSDGFGVTGEGSPLPTINNCVAFGFRQAFGSTFSSADRLVADQINELPVSDNLADPYWQKIGAAVDAASTVPGPFNVPLQLTASNFNLFSRLQAATAKSVPPGEFYSFSAIVAQPTSLVSALFVSSPQGNPEVRVTWTNNPPTISLLGQSGGFRLTGGRLDDLGNDAYRILLIAQNTTSAPIDVTPVFYITRGVENSGLLVGMFAGALMAGCGFLGNGYVPQGSLPGTNGQEGIDPVNAIVSPAPATLDARPIAGGPLDAQSALVEQTDIYFRVRRAPDTIGPVSLSTAPLIRPSAAISSNLLDSARLIDSQDILNAQRQRTVLPAFQSRRIGV